MPSGGLGRRPLKTELFEELVESIQEGGAILRGELEPSRVFGRTALITGGSRGIGFCVVQQLRELGWAVVAPTRAELDFSSAASMSRFIVDGWADAVAPDAVVFCHGTWFSRPIGSRGEADWLEQYRLRVVEPMRLIDDMLFAGRVPKCVIMVASTRGFVGGVDTGPYAAACAAQIALMQGYAREWPGCRFNVVCPGLTDTAMGQEVIATGGAKPGAVGQDPRAVAQAIISLITTDACGKVLRVVDGEVSEATWSW